MYERYLSACLVREHGVIYFCVSTDILYSDVYEFVETYYPEALRNENIIYWMSGWSNTKGLENPLNREAVLKYAYKECRKIYRN